MADFSKIDFIAAVKKSRVIDSDRFAQWLAAIDAKDPAELASKMVRDQLLTKWQAKYIMSGRTRLDIGSYRLLERTKRDELGDRFLAIHTQLGRKVEIQILPADLTKDKSRCELFIQKASSASNLDHPNLVHVFDIDQEGGRYFLVTEHVDGSSLQDVPRESLSETDVARIVQQAIAATQYAHDNDVMHGDLTCKDLIIGSDKTVKIQHLAESAVRSRSNPNDLTDFQAIAKVAKSLLEGAAPSDSSESLSTILDRLSSGNSESLANISSELGDWLEVHGGGANAEVMNDDFGLDQKDDFDQPLAATSFEEQKTKHQTEDGGADEEFAEEEFVEPAGPIARFAQEHTVALMAMITVLVLITVSGVTWGYHQWSNRAQAEKMVTAPKNSTDAGKQSSNRNKRRNPRKPDANDLANRTADEPDPQSATGENRSPEKLKKPDFSDTDAMKRMISQVVPSRGSEQSSKDRKPVIEQPPTTTALDKTTSHPDSTAPSTASIQSPEASKSPAAPPEQPEAASDPTNQNENAGLDPERNVETDSKNAAAQTERATDGDRRQQPAADKDPFVNFPKRFDLPAIEDTKEHKIGDLVINNRFLLGAEIYADPAVCKTKLIFELVRTEDDKQKWIATVRRRPRETPARIASFKKTDTEFLFQWLPEAEDNRYAPFLRNCLIKLKLPEFNTWLSLREPLLLKPLILTADALTVSLETEVSSLPDLGSISIEVLPMRIPNVETNVDQKVIDFQRGLPGRILLKDSDKNAFVWIQVNADLKSKLRAQAAVVVLLANGQTQPIQSLQALSELAVTLKQRELIAFSELEAARNKRAPSGEGDKYDAWRDGLQKSANLAKSQTGKAIQYAEILPQILDHPISIRVYAKLGEHRLELAKMEMFDKQ